MTASQLDLQIPPLPTKERESSLRSYHTRNRNVPVDEALRGEHQARREDTEILRLFRAAPQGERFTPSEVHALLVILRGHAAPLLTSVRRSLSNLSDAKRYPDGPPLFHHEKDKRPSPRSSKRRKATETTWELRGTR